MEDIEFDVEPIIGTAISESKNGTVGVKLSSAASGRVKKYKPKISESMVNEFMKWILTVDVKDYPKYKAVINQYQKYGRNARFQVLDLFRLWLEK